jgi:hypothetical protein
MKALACQARSAPDELVASDGLGRSEGLGLGLPGSPF